MECPGNPQSPARPPQNDQVDLSPSEKIDARIASLTDWRGEKLALFRKLFHQAGPEITKEWKWRGTPVWEHDGIIAVGDAYKNKVKITFRQGAFLPDPKNVFNAGLDGNKWRAIDFFEGDDLNETAFMALVRDAAAFNTRKKTVARSTRTWRRLGVISHGTKDVHRKSRKVRQRDRDSRTPAKNPSSFQEEIPRSPKATATPPCRPTSPLCRNGNPMSVVDSTTSS